MRSRFKKFLPLVVLLAIVTAMLTLKKVGINGLFLENWMSFYVLAMLIIFPIVIMVFPKFDKLIGRKLGNRHIVVQGFAFVIPMITFVGSLMTGVSIVALYQVRKSQEFISLWSTELVNNAPIFFVVALLVGGIVKPLIIRKKQRLAKVKA